MHTDTAMTGSLITQPRIVPWSVSLKSCREFDHVTFDAGLDVSASLGRPKVVGGNFIVCRLSFFYHQNSDLPESQAAPSKVACISVWVSHINLFRHFYTHHAPLNFTGAAAERRKFGLKTFWFRIEVKYLDCKTRIGSADNSPTSS